MYTRALAALQLSAAKRSLVISTLEGRRDDGSLKDLKEVAVQISGLSSDGSEKAALMAQPEEERGDDEEAKGADHYSLPDAWVAKGGKRRGTVRGRKPVPLKEPCGTLMCKIVIKRMGNLGSPEKGSSLRKEIDA